MFVLLIYVLAASMAMIPIELLDRWDIFFFALCNYAIESWFLE